ncbi:hypothetical protein [Acidilobus saccharovorans]|uniref:hypothetical protein n=1 Tax=Acidilobus saccharovorans TaxID=242703 RepID=UPI000662AF09|nr:hypothetical protein [Acidilobus saccharovorans]
MTSRDVTIYFHPSCETSHEVITGLRRAGALGRVRLVRLGSLEAVRLGVLSVPWVTVGDEPAATDPVSAEEVIDIVNGSKVDPGDPVEAFMNSVLHSSLASAVAILHGSLAPVAVRELVSAAVRSPVSGVRPEQVIGEVIRKDRELFAEWRDKLRRALSISFVRELYWASGGALSPQLVRELSRPEVVGLWLLGKGSLGRSALPYNPKGSASEDVEWIAEFVSRTASGLLEKVREEQEGIYSDKEYMEVVSSASGPSGP